MSCSSSCRKTWPVVFFAVLVLSGCAAFKTDQSDLSMRASSRDIIESRACTERGENISEKAFDGDKNTRWESLSGIDKSWIIFKLKPGKILETMRIYWENAGASEYEIKISEDGKNWQAVSAVFDGMGGEERNIKFAPVETRYAGIFCSKRTGDWGYSIYEIELNPLVLLPEEKAVVSEATASSSSESVSPNDAVDGNPSSRWDSRHGIDPQWLQLKLDAPQKVRAVKIQWEKASAKKYEIQTSLDGSNWKTAARINDGKEEELRVITFPPVEAEYVRMFGRVRNGEWGYSIFEMEVYR